MKKIAENFLVISQYNRDLSWVPEYTDNYLIYDRGDKKGYPATIDRSKVVESPNVGYNSYDYFRYIVDHYDNLPEVVIFAKSWTWPRHVTKERFDQIMNNRYFTPICDGKLHKDKWPYGFSSPEGLVCELNTDVFLVPERPTKYVHGFNDFLRFCFKDPVIPRYRIFAPGGDYIVPRENILKLPKVFYENLKLFTSHHHHCGETHIIERAMVTLWTGSFELNPNMLKPLGKDFAGVPRGYGTSTAERQPKAFFNKAIGAARRLSIRALRRALFLMEAKSVA